MSFIPKPFEIYKHFKGNLYQIIAVAQHSETDEKLVVYQALYGDFRIYARPLDMFTGRLDREKYPDVLQEYRFELQERTGEEPDDQAEKAEPAGSKNTDISDTEPAEVPDTAELPESPEMPDAAELPESESFEEPVLDPMVLEFLDADSYEQRINILTGLHHRITDDMITVMAIASDVEVGEGDTEERYVSLRNCLLTLERYECNRLK